MKRLRAVLTGLLAAGLSVAMPAWADKPAKAPAKDKPAAPAKAEGKAPAGTKWRVTTTMQIPNAPMAPPPITYEFCQTETARVPQQPNSMAGSCKMLEHKFENRKATWKVRCEGQMVMIGEGSITYDTDTFAGEITMKGEGEGAAFAMVQKMSGQKLGTCTPQ